MKSKILLIIIAGMSLLYANNNISNNGTFINNGTINNEQINNYEAEKVEFDARIKQLASKLLQSNSNENNKYTSILSAATEANKFDVDKNTKKEKCVEYAMSLNFIKNIDLSFARKECNNIFN